LLVRSLRRELETLVHARPSVAQLARRLGVSTSTLTRTCNEVLGHSAKEELDRRVALEAQRLLVHGASTSVAIGEFLGFSEPTNFVKFFRRRVGTTPEAFRQEHRLQHR
jgi:AraC-like DNA-binding protein